LILDTLNLLSKKMKRRDFITTTAGVAAGASILTNPVGAAIAPAAKNALLLLELATAERHSGENELWIITVI
jgi:hypothetical protein